MQTIRGQPRKTRRRVAPAAAAGSAGSAVATRDTPTAPYDIIGPDADTGSTAFVTPEATLADTIATAVLRQLEQSGRLLPARPVTPAVADDVAEAEPQNHGDELSLDSAEVDVDAALSGILGGESYTPLPSYNVFNRPLGADLPDTLKSKIRRGDYVNLQLLLSSDNDDDGLNEQQHQHLTLEVRPNQDSTLSLMKSSRTKEITTIDQWVAAFTIFGAILTESFPQLLDLFDLKLLLVIQRRGHTTKNGSPVDAMLGDTNCLCEGEVDDCEVLRYAVQPQSSWNAPWSRPADSARGEVVQFQDFTFGWHTM